MQGFKTIPDFRLTDNMKAAPLGPVRARSDLRGIIAEIIKDRVKKGGVTFDADALDTLSTSIDSAEFDAQAVSAALELFGQEIEGALKDLIYHQKLDTIAANNKAVCERLQQKGCELLTPDTPLPFFSYTFLADQPGVIEIKLYFE